jgi:hypothetical protein
MPIRRPICPTCQTRTVLARVTPGPIGFDIRTFECPACKHVNQTVVELLIEPMKSITTNTGHSGQLQAPT